MTSGLIAVKIVTILGGAIPLSTNVYCSCTQINLFFSGNITVATSEDAGMSIFDRKL